MGLEQTFGTGQGTLTGTPAPTGPVYIPDLIKWPQLQADLYKTYGSALGRGDMDLFDANQPLGQVSQEYLVAIADVLAAKGITMNQIPYATFVQLAQTTATDPTMQQLAQYGTQYLASNLSRVLFNPSDGDNPTLTQAGINLLGQANQPLSTAQQSFLATGTGGSSAVRQAIIETALSLGQAAGMDQATQELFIQTALATAYNESGLRADAVGDKGTSFGLFQLHQGGELGSMTPQEAFDPRTNARTALAEFIQVWKNNPSIASNPGQWAAQSQRPADPSGYASTIDNLMGDIQGGWMPTTTAPGVVDPYTTKQYSPLISAFEKYAGHRPTMDELRPLLGMTADQADTYLRSLPSHLAGISTGTYQDLKAAADKEMVSVYGHEAADSVVQDIYNQGFTGANSVKYFVDNLGFKPGTNVSPVVYNAIYTAAKAPSADYYNQPPDPRHLQQVWEQNGSPGAITNQEAQQVAQTDPVKSPA